MPTISYRQHPGTPLGYSVVYTAISDGDPVGEIRKTDPRFDTEAVFEAYDVTGRKLGTGKTRKAAAAHLVG